MGLENFMLLATSVFMGHTVMSTSPTFQKEYSEECIGSTASKCASSFEYADVKIRGACAFYLAMRCMYIIFTISPPIFMMKTATWCMGWGACAYIFCIGISYTEAAYEI